MSDFLTALMNEDLPFLRYALTAGILASFSFGIIGTFVVARRISYIAGAISHSVLGGVGLGLYLQYKVGIGWFHPQLGAVLAAVISALIIGYVSLKGNQREDTVIGAIWAFGMAIGLLFIAKTPGYTDPMSYLFGNILLISKTDLWMVAGLDVLVVSLGIFFYNKFLAISFDSEFTLLRGVRADAYFLLLLVLTALTIVLLVRIVGIVMVIALLTLPAAVAGHFSRRLWQMMVIAIILSMFFIVFGLGFSYTYDLPSGPSIIFIAGVIYIVVVFGSRMYKKKLRARK